jgi:hypothetical protein
MFVFDNNDLFLFLGAEQKSFRKSPRCEQSEASHFTQVDHLIVSRVGTFRHQTIVSNSTSGALNGAI